MSRRLIIGAIVIFLAGTGLAMFLLWAHRPIVLAAPSDDELAHEYAKLAPGLGLPPRLTKVQTQAILLPIDLSHPVRLAVGGLGLEDNDQNRQLGDLVTVKLTGAPGFELVERQSLAAVLQELNLNWSGFVRAKDVVRAGKLLKADWFLLGTEAKISETNCLVVRVVDARTGVMRDAGVFPMDQPALQLAADLSQFMSQSRENAAEAKTRVYLAVGAFEDLGVNNRRADFTTQLRGYLTGAYRGSSVTLLEREYVETLLREVQLDLAGLTEENGPNPPPPMQSAFWVVNGQYQSYETTNLQVEVNLEVHRVFGKFWHKSLRGLPGEPVDRQIKQAVDETMSQNSEVINPTRTSEAHIQMEIGKEMCSFEGFETFGLALAVEMWNADPQLAVRQKRQIEEAAHAFETVLLLEPTNHLAKMYLAACLRTHLIYRLDEACNYYEEIIDDPAKDRWSDTAHEALVQTLNNLGPEDRLHWLQAAAAKTTNVLAASFYGKQAEQAEGDIIVGNGNSTKAAEIAEQRLFQSFQSFKNFIENKPGTYDDDMGMGVYVKAFGWDRPTTGQKLAELLPRMEEKAPGLEPYLLATVLTYQVDTNTPLAAEFQQVLTQVIERPTECLAPFRFWNKISCSLYDWCIEKTNDSLAIQILEGEQRVAAGGQVPGLDFDDMEKIKLGYAYIAVQRWQDALGIFESFNNRPVQAIGDGPWGESFKLILTDKMTDICREHLGLKIARDPRRFDMGKPVLCLCSPSTFVVDDSGLWVGIEGRLLHLDFDLRTNLVVQLPMDEGVPITTLCLTPSKIWIGTQGAGLIEFDKAGRQCRRLTEADGLMMDDVASLEVAGDSLWIGYGSDTRGGLGRLDLGSQKLTSFMPSLNGAASSLHSDEAPPRERIGKIVAGMDGDVWVSVASVIRRFYVAHGTWETLPNRAGDWTTCLSADSEHVAEGGGVQLSEVEISSKPIPASPTNQIKKNMVTIRSHEERQLRESFKTNANCLWISLDSTGKLKPRGAVAFQNLRDHRWQYLEDPDGLPNPPTTITLAGNDLWVGGEGAIARVDVTEGKVAKFCHIQAASVDHIAIGGGYVWAQFDWHLYRVPLSDMR